MTEEEPQQDPKPNRRRRWGAIFGSVFSTVVSLSLIGGIAIGAVAVLHPESPLPPEWNPNTPLVVDAPVSVLTSWKLRRALNDPAQCLSVLEVASRMSALDPFEETEHCHVRNRVSISGVGQARLDAIDTSCATALRLAMWEHHGIQPAAQELLGTDVSIIRQVGSYNCRPIRTTQGASERWSTHSTADAIDISGFDLADGRRIRLIDDWEGEDATAAFLHAVRDSACTWFATTLGPDYNSLHADHFHLQARGWGTCR
ncbi:extensin family protein [Octadecabacter sp.]|nr:extensin family protein [Octadecabacter sp.]